MPPPHETIVPEPVETVELVDEVPEPQTVELVDDVPEPQSEELVIDTDQVQEPHHSQGPASPPEAPQEAAQNDVETPDVGESICDQNHWLDSSSILLHPSRFWHSPHIHWET